MIEVKDILMFLAGNSEEDLNRKVNDWMAIDPKNKDEIALYRKIWNSSEECKQHKVLDASAAWYKIEPLLVE